jgi:cytochrome c oxidase subunit 2
MTSPRFVHRKATRFATALLAGTGLAFLSGCNKLTEIFSLSGPQSTVHVSGPVAQSQQNLFMVTVYVTTFIFIVVGSVLAYAQIKFRAKSEADEHAEPPPETHGNPFVEIGLIAASVALLVVIAIPTLQGIWFTHDVPEEEKGNAIDITATGYQWWFKFEYPSEIVKQANNGGEAPLVTANELVVPAGYPIRVQLRTLDVIHSFWVPKLAGKVDMIPNRPNFLWFKADKPGYFYGQCAEYCGESHAIMRFRIIAVPPAEYARWLENQKQPARTVTAQSLAVEAAVPHVQFASMKMTAGEALSGSPEFDADPLGSWRKMQNPEAENDKDPKLIETGHQLFANKTCMNCHTIRGHFMMTGSQPTYFQGIVGPDLTRVGARSTIAAGVLENTHERMHSWIKTPDHFKPGNKMYNGFGGMTGYMKPDDKGDMVPNIILNDEEIDALVAYLHSLK